MPHVMVPCPEELLPEFTIGLMRLTMGMAGWDDASVARFLAELEAWDRSFVLAVANASIDEGQISYRSLARRTGLDVGDVLDLVTTINDRCRRASLPLPLITDTRLEPDGDGERAVPVLAILPRVAQAMVAAGGAIPDAPGPDAGEPPAAGPPS